MTEPYLWLSDEIAAGGVGMDLIRPGELVTCCECHSVRQPHLPFFEHGDLPYCRHHKPAGAAPYVPPEPEQKRPAMPVAKRRKRSTSGARRSPYGPRVDLAGRVVGRLTVEGWAENGSWRCRCECGGERIVATKAINVKAVKECCRCARAAQSARMKLMNQAGIPHLGALKTNELIRKRKEEGNHEDER